MTDPILHIYSLIHFICVLILWFEEKLALSQPKSGQLLSCGCIPELRAGKDQHSPVLGAAQSHSRWTVLTTPQF